MQVETIPLQQQNSMLKLRKQSRIPRLIINGKNHQYASFDDDEDEINDVVVMSGINLAEENQKILENSKHVELEPQSCKEELLLDFEILHERIKNKMKKFGLDAVPSDNVAELISHATQEYLKNLIEKLAVVAEHRMDNLKVLFILFSWIFSQFFYFYFN